MTELELKGKSWLFADDSSFLYSGSSVTQNVADLNHDVKILESYFAFNQFTVNVSKTTYVHFKSPNKPLLSSDTSIRIYGETVKQAKLVRFLGVDIDETLSFKPQVERVRNQLSMVSGMMFTARKILPFQAKLNLYNSLFHSRLIYGCEGWASAYPSTLEPLQVQQNRMIKLNHNLPVLTPTMNLFNGQHFFTLPVRSHFDCCTALMMFKMFKIWCSVVSCTAT